MYTADTGVWQRAADQDNAPEAEIVNGVLISNVLAGDVNQGGSYVITSIGGGAEVNGKKMHTIGSDAIKFEQYTTPTELIAGVGIDALAFASKTVQMDLVTTGGLAFTGQEVGIDWATDFTTDAADAKAFRASELSSTSTNQGASLVGIEDASDYYAGTDAEDAFNELEAQIGGTSSTAFNFTEDNVLADNDPIYAALDKLDLKHGDYASTLINEGASLIAVHDAAGNFTSTDVEGALAELATNAGVFYEVDTGSVGIGDLVYISDNNKVTIYDPANLVGHRGIGVATSAQAAGTDVKVAANDTVVSGVDLTGASVGDPVYWDSGLTTSIPVGGGKYVWQVGVAKDITTPSSAEMHVEVRFVKKNA